MANEPTAMDPGDLWRCQPAAGTALSVEEARRRARSFEKTIRRRNLREYVAALLVVLFFGAHAAIASETWARVGSLLIVAGTLYVAARLHKKGSAALPPTDAALRPCLKFHRAELERQRDLLRGVWWWYLLPLVPGLAVLLAGRVLTDPHTAWRVGGFATFCALIFFGIGWLNNRAARELQRQIDELET